MLNDRQVYAIIELIEDRGWEVLEQRVQGRIETARNALLKDPSRARKDKLPDDYLRGQIEALEWCLSWPKATAEQRMSLEDEEKATRRRRAAADLQARLGPTFPGAGSGLPEV
jgi:hypothetical protein